MNRLAGHVADYLALRRALGYKLERAEKLLTQFVNYLEQTGAATVTIDNAVAWATLPAGYTNWWAHRLSVVRCFTAYLVTVDPEAELPPTDVLAWRPHRATPYLYSDGDIAALLAAATGLRSELRVATYRTLVGLLAVTGLRVGEAIRLDRADLDLSAGELTVWHAKFNKSRRLPLHLSTVEALRSYLRRRDRLHPRPTTPALFISPAGTRLIQCNVQSTFRQLVARAGLQPRSVSCRPRIHDLRHSFAVRCVLDGYRCGADVQARLPLISTYMGHVDPKATYWYLSAAPELLGLAGVRLDAHLGALR
jgi:integrase